MWSPLASRKAGSPTHSFLGQSLLVASDMLCQEHAPELGKRIGLRVVESPKDDLPLWDRESEHPRLTLPCLLEPGGQVRFPGASKQASQLEDIGVRDRDAGELHAQRATRAESRENAAWGSASSTLTSLDMDAGSAHRFKKASGRVGLPPPLPLPWRRCRRVGANSMSTGSGRGAGHFGCPRDKEMLTRCSNALRHSVSAPFGS